MTDLSPPNPLTARSQAALAHYREQAARARRQAAADRARAFHLVDVDEALALRVSADELDAQAAQWDVLAAELEAFAEQQTPASQEALL